MPTNPFEPPKGKPSSGQWVWMIFALIVAFWAGLMFLAAIGPQLGEYMND